MTYIENVFICMASPLLIAALCMGRRQAKFFLCCLAGMGACLLSAYINTFFAALYAADTLAATAEIAPVVEEVMKLLPLLFYLLVFEPEPVPIKNASIIVALSFATFENICYLLEHGTGNLFYLLVRGFSTGAMHITCAFIIGYGLRVFRRPAALKASGIFALLCVAITFHAMFNMIMKTEGLIKQFGYAVPIVSCLILFLLKYRFRKITDLK